MKDLAGRDVFITNLQQKIPRNSSWFTFLGNGHAKTELIQALVRHSKSIDVRNELLHQIIVTKEEKTWYITKDGTLETPDNNDVEVDTRTIMEAVKSESPVIVKAADTDDIFILVCYAHSHERKTN